MARSADPELRESVGRAVDVVEQRRKGGVLA
jgi:hypothetical protein